MAYCSINRIYKSAGFAVSAVNLQRTNFNEPCLFLMMNTVYGIPNCDTVKKTQDWLKEHSVEYTFHNYKLEGISKEKLVQWCKEAGWETVLNRKSSTWKKLSPEVQQKVTNQTEAIKVMMENNSSIKRPVIDTGKKILVGYDEEAFIKHLK
jgi:arsenate reductase